MVLACNRKAKSDNERIVGIYQAHFGPVYALERNPCFPKVIIERKKILSIIEYISISYLKILLSVFKSYNYIIRNVL